MKTIVSNRILTLPNLISFIRLLLVPIFAVLLVGYENNIAAFIIFLVAVSTDFLDGAVARATGQITQLGQQLDPLVDRVLILTAVILVFILGRVPLWILVLLIARDMCMLVMLIRLQAAGEPRPKVVMVGKMATALNMAGFCSLILFWPELGGLGIIDAGFLPGWGSSPALLGIWLLYLGTILAWAAGIYYMLNARRRTRRLSAEQDLLDQYHGVAGGDNINGTNGTNGMLNATGNGNGNGSGSKRRVSSSHIQSRQNIDASPWESRALRQAGTASKKNTLASVDKGQRRGLGNTKAGTAAAHTSVNNGQRRRSGKTQAGTVALKVLDTPQKLLVGIAICLLLFAFLGFYGCDSIRNFGVIHHGVQVGTVEVGGMAPEEAAELLAKELGTIATLTPITLYANEAAAAVGVNDGTLQLGNGVSDLNPTEGDAETQTTSWSITLGTLNAEVNGTQLAEEAYAIGRNGDFFLGRLGANLFGVTLAPRIDIAEERLIHLEEMLTLSIGTPMINASMSFDGERFVVADGQDGTVVDEKAFIDMLQLAFFSINRELVVPMVERSMRVNREAAEAVAAKTQQDILKPLTLTYSDASWTLVSEQLGAVITSAVEQSKSGNWHLVPTIDPSLLETVIPAVVGHLEDQVAPVNAEFVMVDGQLSITPSQSGTGISYERLAQDIEAVLFGNEALADEAVSTSDRTVPIQIGALEPTLTTSDAEAYGFSTLINEYTLLYPYVPPESVINIHVVSDHINSSIIAPHATWSLIDTVGEFTPENGFVDSQIIVGDEYVDGMGGGVCTVATTVFNIVWEAGYPIVERVNHSLRATRYPLGRDAAIAYPYADLKFQNNTDNYLLMTLDYTQDSVTCYFWGTPPGYTVESVVGEFIEIGEFHKKEILDQNMLPGSRHLDQEGLKASKVEVTRIVYDAQGELLEKRIFYSSYDATPEVVKIGPKVVEPDPPPPPPPPTPAPSTPPASQTPDDKET
ncbi:MAG: VanW family protein [Coriobacteriia bacterium]|nr:VanW family protein [Coriobacteriia bacterium]